MCSKASDVLGCNGDILGLADQRLDTLPLLDLTKKIEKVVREFRPDIVYTHWHRVVKDGVTLSYGGDLSAAKRHAARCGGTVISTPRKK